MPLLKVWSIHYHFCLPINTSPCRFLNDYSLISLTQTEFSGWTARKSFARKPSRPEALLFLSALVAKKISVLFVGGAAGIRMLLRLPISPSWGGGQFCLINTLTLYNIGYREVCVSADVHDGQFFWPTLKLWLFEIITKKCGEKEISELASIVVGTCVANIYHFPIWSSF